MLTLIQRCYLADGGIMQSLSARNVFYNLEHVDKVCMSKGMTKKLCCVVKVHILQYCMKVNVFIHRRTRVDDCRGLVHKQYSTFCSGTRRCGNGVDLDRVWSKLKGCTTSKLYGRFFHGRYVLKTKAAVLRRFWLNTFFCSQINM